MADFRAFQSSKDREIAALKAEGNENRLLADEAFTRLRDTESRIAAFEERGYDEHDPQVATLLKARDAQAKDLQSKLRQYELREKQLLPAARDWYVEKTAWDLADGDRSRVTVLKEQLAAGGTQKQIDALAQAIRSGGGGGQTTMRAPRAEELDAGRGTGRAGRGTVNAEIYRQHLGDADGGRAWRAENKDVIATWMANGAR